MYMANLENFSLYEVTASIVLDKRRSKSETLYPVKYRVTYLRKQVYYGSGIDLNENDWNFLPDTRIKELKATRESIIQGFEKYKHAIKDIYKQEGEFSFDILKKYVSCSNKESVFEKFESTIKSLEDEERIGSAIAYKCALNSLKNFQKDKPLFFKDITVNFLKSYEKWMIDSGNSYTTIGIYLRQFRAIINEAKRDHLIKESAYPFGEGKYEIPTGVGKKKALSINQIKAIVNYKAQNDIMEKCRDLWFFSYLCNGINIGDLCRLKFSDIDQDEISFYRQKTIRTAKEKKKITVTVLPDMLKIIEKWGNEWKNENFIFPYFSKNTRPKEAKKIVQNLTRQINDYMTRIGEDLKIGSISTYVARHSFATVLKRSGANIAFIGESLGHTGQKTTENYLAAFEKEERLKNAQLLTKF